MEYLEVFFCLIWFIVWLGRNIIKGDISSFLENNVFIFLS